MTTKSISRVAFWLGLFLLSFVALWFAVSLLPAGIHNLGRGLVVLAFLLLGLYAADVVLPGFNFFSHAPSRLPTSANTMVALTFDDGPTEPCTRALLDVLDRHHAKATFFCLGENIALHPGLAQEIVKRGHDIGNHSYAHKLLPFCSKSEIVSELSRANQTIESTTGLKPRWLRCPKGYKSRRVQNVAKRLGLDIIGFSYPIFDVENPPHEELVARVLGRVRGRDILLMHDGYRAGKVQPRDSIVKALPLILEGLSAKGLRAVSLSQALGARPSHQTPT